MLYEMPLAASPDWTSEVSVLASNRYWVDEPDICCLQLRNTDIQYDVVKACRSLSILTEIFPSQLMAWVNFNACGANEYLQGCIAPRPTCKYNRSSLKFMAIISGRCVSLVDEMLLRKHVRRYVNILCKGCSTCFPSCSIKI